MEEQTRGADSVSSELAALTVIVKALQPLSPAVRERVISSAVVLLGGSQPSGQASLSSAPVSASNQAIASSQPAEGRTINDIRTLKEEKQPRSASEMATLVAYYLAELAPPSERKDRITSGDITKYFKQAPFQLPANAKMTLVHSKNAGYLDALGSGEYALNPVGYNLVAHNLPSTKGAQSTQKKKKKGTSRPSKKAGSKKGRKKP